MIFTASNRHPEDRHSLHYIHPFSKPPRPLNDYEQAITSVVSIIEEYDSDKKFPVLGFGAVLPPPNNYRTSHKFYVTMNPLNADCIGVEGKKIVIRYPMESNLRAATRIQYVIFLHYIDLLSV